MSIYTVYTVLYCISYIVVYNSDLDKNRKQEKMQQISKLAYEKKKIGTMYCVYCILLFFFFLILYKINYLRKAVILFYNRF